MKNIQEHIDLIERFLHDDLAQEELDELNEKLRKDNEFNKLFYEMDHLLDGIRQSAKNSTVEEKLARLEQALPYKMSITISEKPVGRLKKVIISINQFFDRLIAKVFNLDQEELTAIPINSHGQASVLTISGRIKLIAASTIIVVFLATTLMFIQFTEYNPGALYADNFEQPELQTVAVRSADDEEKNADLTHEEIINLANLEFNDSNFGKAINLIEKIPDEEKMPSMKYCGALSYMKKEDFNRAKELLTQLSEEKDIVWRHRSKWFLALCLIREDNKAEAVKYLKDVSDTNGGEFQEDAVQLLKKVDK
jgi:hypothetical protein